MSLPNIIDHTILKYVDDVIFKWNLFDSLGLGLIKVLILSILVLSVWARELVIKWDNSWAFFCVPLWNEVFAHLS